MSAPSNSSGSKRRKADSKAGKGLRHFSMKVCEKVRTKGITTYAEVADELVSEFSEDPVAKNQFENGDDKEPFDQKNIRRRVYDALNVLMAINIISKERKQIKWVGLPSHTVQEVHDLEQERQARATKIKERKAKLRELMLQQVCIRTLTERNQKHPPNIELDTNSILRMPFIAIETNQRTSVDCAISTDKTEYTFTFDNAFEVHEDFEVLQRMGYALGLDKVKKGQGPLKRADYLKIKSFLPDAIGPELDDWLKDMNVQVVD